MHGVWFSGSTPYKDVVDAVFLPMAGYVAASSASSGNFVVLVGYYGDYWSSTKGDGETAYKLNFCSELVSVCCEYHSSVHSVRCVKD